MKCQVVECENEVFDVSGVMGFALCKAHLHGTDQNIPELVGEAALLMEPVYRLCEACGEATSMLDDGTSAQVWHEHHVPHERKARVKAVVEEPAPAKKKPAKTETEAATTAADEPYDPWK